MLPFYTDSFIKIFPEIFIGLSICYLLVFCSFYGTKPFIKTLDIQLVSHRASFFILFLVSFLLLNSFFISGFSFFGTFFVSFSTQIIKLFSLVFVLSFFFFGSSTFHKQYPCSFEFFILVLFSIFGIFIIVNSNDLLGIYLGLELQSLCIYALVSSSKKSAFSTEAGLKYFVMGAFSSGLLLFGFSLIYGFAGTSHISVLSNLFSVNFFDISSIFINIGVLLFFIGILFKLAVSPWHMWAPDVYEGAPSNVAIFISISPKIFIFYVLVKLSYSCFFSFSFIWGPFLLACGFLSIVFGSFGALSQKKLKRFFVFSSISHIGYCIVSLSCSSFLGLQNSFFYIFLYLIISFPLWSLFVLTLSFRQKGPIYLDELEQFFKYNSFYSFTFCIILFSIAGIPPLAGFYSKIFVFFSLMESNIVLASVIIVLLGTLGSVYYLKVIKIFFFTTFFNRINSYLSKRSFFIEFSFFQSLIISYFFIFILFFGINPSFPYIVAHLITLENY
uniref:NADH dehydrogenase subunit 2 n=1 Tax=Thraustochytrium aureum TaxID=42467 RepID=Q9G4D9_9STRA|nr:NADH dehydrogenase subunit 2 [Thraustochytrium aureum]